MVAGAASTSVALRGAAQHVTAAGFPRRGLSSTSAAGSCPPTFSCQSVVLVSRAGTAGSLPMASRSNAAAYIVEVRACRAGRGGHIERRRSRTAEVGESASRSWRAAKLEYNVCRHGEAAAAAHSAALRRRGSWWCAFCDCSAERFGGGSSTLSPDRSKLPAQRRCAGEGWNEDERVPRVRRQISYVRVVVKAPRHVGSTPSSSSFAAATKVVADAVQEQVEGFEEMAASTKRRYYMIGGKGGVGKTSLAASLAVKFANSGHPTLVVSTDPAHSLSDSFAQDVSGGVPVVVDGTDLPLYAMEIDPEQARQEFRASSSKDGGSGVKDFMDSMGLGGWIEQLSELKLGELLDTPPPGLDEAVAISKVVQFMQAPEYEKFTRIIFDTAPTGHTLRLLSLPDFLEASIGKILKLKAKVTQATSAVKSLFGQGDDSQDTATEKLEALKDRMLMVRDIFRDKESTEFVIVTIPTFMAVSESSRLLTSLEKEGVPVKRLVVNQILPKSMSDCKFCNIKRKDQLRALDLVKADPGLKGLQITEAPLFDLEIRGVPALRFMGDLVWK